MNSELHLLYSQLPAIDRLLRDADFQPLLADYGTTLVTDALRHLQAKARQTIQQQYRLPEWGSRWAEAVRQYLMDAGRAGLRPVLNLSGTVLHSNLGRAPLSEAAIEATCQAMRHPVTLEYDLASASRGHRDKAVAALLCELTGAEAACIVNNNAAAVLLILSALAAHRQVVVSRGELVEIGGTFRIPDVMRQAGCQLIEVGTTNRTYLNDYQQAISEETALLMKVHTSNFTIEGFTTSVSEQALVKLGQSRGIPVITDLGSGALLDMRQFGLPAEPMPQTLIADGVDLVCFSADKLLGGPQAGIIVGRQHWIDLLQQHPLKRALRVDKMGLAALEATLRLYRQADRLDTALPALRLLTRPQTQIQACAERLLPVLEKKYGQHFLLRSEPCWSQIGSGSQPANRLPSWALTLTAKDGRGRTLEALFDQWLNLPKPVIGRIQDGRIWLDLRCLEEEHQLLEALAG